MDRIIKRILAVSAVLIISSGFCFGIVNSAEQLPETQKNEISTENNKASLYSDIEEEKNLLTSLGILSLSEDFETILDEKVSGRDVSDYLNRMIKLDRSFSYITTESEMVTFSEAVRLIVRALDYHHILPNGETTDIAYFTVGQRMKLFRGISIPADNSLNKSNLIKLIFNGLNCECLEFSTSGNGPVYKISSGNTYLKKLFNVEKKTGIVTGTKGSRTGDSLFNGRIEIDGVMYKLSTRHDVNIEDLLGMYVSFYLRGEDDSDYEIIVIDPVENRNSVLVIDSKDIDGPNTSKTEVFYFNSDEKILKALISKNAVVYYNGKLEIYGNLTDADFVPEYGNLTLIDNDGDRKFDYVLISNYKMYVAQSSTFGYISFKYGSMDIDTQGNKVKRDYLKINENFRLYREGIEISSDYIGEWDCVRVKMSKDGSSGVIDVSREEIDGFVESIYEEKQREYVTISGKKYEVSDIFKQSLSVSGLYGKKLEIGSSGIFIINQDKCLVAIKSVSGGNMEYGFLVNMSSADKLDKAMRMKIFEKYGKMSISEVSESIKINGTVVNDNKKLAEMFTDSSTGEFKSQLIMYKKNSKGEISELETAKDASLGNGVLGGYDKDHFSLDDYQTGRTWSYSRDESLLTIGGAISSRLQPNTEVLLFCIPKDRNDDSRYVFNLNYNAVNSYSKNTDIQVFDTVKYNENYDFKKATVIVLYERVAGTLSSEESDFIIVTSCKKAVDEGGEAVWKLKGVLAGNNTTYEGIFIDTAYNSDVKGENGFGGKKVKDLKSGDLITVSYVNKYSPALRINSFKCYASADYYSDFNNLKSFQVDNAYNDKIPSWADSNGCNVIGDIVYVSDEETIVKTRNFDGDIDYFGCFLPTAKTYNYDISSQRIYEGSASKLKKGDHVFLRIGGGMQVYTIIIVCP